MPGLAWYGEEWYGRIGVKFPKPKKILTPYGGRLVWKLPGGSDLVVHLKDKNKIRHKKRFQKNIYSKSKLSLVSRWSQIMYMYYFLGFQLYENTDIEIKDKDKKAANTFLLALDGDVDFLPDAVIKVVDLLGRKNSLL